jgi:CRP/FNR family transcriptional regulator
VQGLPRPSEAQRHAIALSSKPAAAKLASFLLMLEQHEPAELGHGHIHLPMTRSDIAAYLGLSLEAVSRTSREPADWPAV